MTLSKGQYVRVRQNDGDDWCPAFVALASESNPASVLLILSGPVGAGGGVVTGVLPLTVDYDAETVFNLFGDSYEIEVAS